MENIKKLLAVWGAAAVFFLGGIEAGAAGMGKLGMVSSETTVRKGQETEFRISLEAYEGISRGINAFMGTLVYDTEVFQTVSQEDFAVLNSWENLYYNPDNGKFVLIKRDGSFGGEETFLVKLTAKETIPAGEVSVTVKDASVSEGSADLFPAEASVRLEAVPEETDASTGGSGNGEIGGSDNGDKENSGSSQDNGDKGDSGSSWDNGENENGGSNAFHLTNSAHTGDSTRVLSYLALALAAAAALVAAAWMAVRKKGKGHAGREKLPAVAAGVITAGLTAALLCGNIYAAGNKGELNGDGQTDYQDAALLKKHLTGLELLSGKEYEKADLNSDGALTITDLSLLVYKIEETASLSGIELKNVTENRLYYRNEAGNTEEIQVLDITAGLPENTENYYAVIEMEGLPDLYAGIRGFRQDPDTGILRAVLDQEDLVFYHPDGTKEEEYAFPLAWRDEDGDHTLVASAEELFQKMAANPGEHYELTEDLDASGISDAAAAVAGAFTGELDGNGYRIRNLKTSLFDTLNQARVHDLVIERAAVTAQRRGILANAVNNQTVIERVFVVDSSISNGVDGLGAFTGELNNSVIRESASIDVSVKGLVAAGGIAGKTAGSDTVIENCYVTGKVQGTYDHWNLGSRVGGITGWHGGGTIRQCFTQVRLIAPARKGNGGLIGGPNTGSPRIENCLSMSTGAGYRIAGFAVLDNAENVYEYRGSDSMTNVTEANREQIKETDRINDRALYEETLGFDSAVWDLEFLSYGKKPNLHAAPVEENQLAIPNYGGLRRNEDYRPDREPAYANMAKLMPFADTGVWVASGNALSEGDALAVKEIQYILPLDGEGKLVTGIRRDTAGQIQKIRLVFADEKMREYPVFYRELTGNLIASYGVEGTGLEYQFRRYAVSADGAAASRAAEIASGYDYTADLAVLTDEEESRLYTDYYNETVRKKLESLAEKLAASQEEYPFYSEHPAVQALAEERLLSETGLKRILYAYNYYDKWYRIDYNGVILSDLLFFNGDLMAEGLTAAELTDRLLSASQAQRETTGTVAFYNHALKNDTGKELMAFLGDLSLTVAGYDNPNDWFADNFDGILFEQKGYETDRLRYRIWDILSGLAENRKTLVLPILTAPQEDMYLVSMPSQLMLGSMNRYQTYLNKDGNERARMRTLIEEYAGSMGLFYGISARWRQDSAEILNSFVDIQFDTRIHFPASDKAAAGEQKKGETTDPVIKWVYEAAGTWSGINGSAAYATGAEVHWMQYAALGLDFYFFSHETAHNQDGKYFYAGEGRRRGTGAEAHADGNITQEMKDGNMVFNISKICDIGTEMTNNFSYERIDSAEKLKSYYEEMFETGYVLDYLAAQAFLELEPEQQAAVAVQAEHTPGGTDSFSTEYRRLIAEDFRNMKLENMDDLWENRIGIRNPETVATATSGSYGFESFYWMNWYQSHNDNGSPDSHSFKRLGQEMLGIGGYEDGYMVYMSLLSENDLDALRKITGIDTITWKDYKMKRYENAAQKLDEIPYFDSGEAIRMFKEAFEADSRNGRLSQSIDLKRTLFGIVKRATGDFSDGGIYESPSVTAVSSAEQLVELAARNPYGFYRLENDLDFSGIQADGGSYIPGRFIGVIDGGGFRVSGLAQPLFGDLQYAMIRNLSFSETAAETELQDLLAVKTKRTVTENVVVEHDILLEEQAEEPAEDMEQAESRTEESRPENGQVEEGQTGESRPENDQIENGQTGGSQTEGGLPEECPEGVPEAPNEEEDEDAETPNEEENEDAEILNEKNPDEPDNSTDNMTV